MYKSLMFGDEFLAHGLYLKSHQRCSAGIRTWLSADQTIEKGPVQTVAIKLEAHNSIEYHNVLKH